MSEKEGSLSTWIMLTVAIISVYLQIFPVKTPVNQLKSLIYFAAIVVYIILAYSLIWGMKRVKSYVNEIEKNKEEINKIKENMETQKKFYELEKKISIIESMLRNKKGKWELDPKLLIIIILLFLFYLYLRSLGILP